MLMPTTRSAPSSRSTKPGTATSLPRTAYDIYIYICIYTSIDVCIYTCIPYVCVYIYIYIYIYGRCMRILCSLAPPWIACREDLIVPCRVFLHRAISGRKAVKTHTHTYTHNKHGRPRAHMHSCTRAIRGAKQRDIYQTWQSHTSRAVGWWNTLGDSHRCFLVRKYTFRRLQFNSRAEKHGLRFHRLRDFKWHYSTVFRQTLKDAFGHSSTNCQMIPSSQISRFIKGGCSGNRV